MPAPAVQVERFSDAQSFLDAAGPFLADREAEHNLLFGIAANLITDPDRPMTAPPYFAAVRRDDEVVAAALMTPPFNVVVSCIDEPDAIPALAADLDRGRFPVPGITAPVEVARAFSERWAERHGVMVERTMAERIYRVERVTRPDDVPGSIRTATCPDCARAYPLADVLLLVGDSSAPACGDCGGILKPDVVFFGELLPEAAMERAAELAASAGLMLVVGSALEVYPVAGLPLETLRSGGALAIVNRGPTAMDSRATLKLDGSAGEILPRVAEVLA